MLFSDPSLGRVHSARGAGHVPPSDIHELIHPNLTLALLTVCSVLVVGIAATLGPPAGVGAVAAIGIGLLVLRRPAYGAFALVAFAPALSGVVRGLPVPGFRLSELMIAGFSAIILVAARTTPRWGAFDWVALSYVIVNGVLVWANLVRHGDPFTADNWGTLFGPLQFFLLYRAVMTALPAPEQRRQALRLLLFTSVAVSALTLMQQYNLGVRPLLELLTGTDIYSSTTRGVPRATGPFPHWHNLGGYLLVILLIGFALLLDQKQRVMRRRTLLLVLVPALAALIQTASFAPLFGLIAGSLVIGISMGKGQRVLAWLGAAALVGALLFGPLLQDRVEQQYEKSSVAEEQSLVPQTLQFRYDVWRNQFLPVIEDNLVTGYGPNLPPNLYFDYAESLYITFLLRGGLPLLLVYLALMGTLLLRARRVAKSDETERRVAGRVVFASVLLLLVIDVIATYFLDSGPAPLLWAMAGLLSYDQVKRGRRPRLVA